MTTLPPWLEKLASGIYSGLLYTGESFLNTKRTTRHVLSGTKHLLSGGAFQLCGRRITLSQDSNTSPEKSLGEIDKKLALFFRNQPLNALGHRPIPLFAPTVIASTPIQPPVNASSSVTPAPKPSNPTPVINQIAETNRQIDTLSTNLTYFVPLYTMAAIGGIHDNNLNEVLIQMVKKISKSTSEGRTISIKDIFYQKYGHRINRFQRFKIFLFNIVGSSSLVSKTIHTYMNHILKEMRTRLADKRWTENGENTEKMIDDLIYFLDVYKNATLNYANTTNPEGTLHQYREQAIEKMYGKSLNALSEEFSNTLVTHFSPTVEYSPFEPLNRILNWIVRRELRKYLPQAVQSIVTQTNNATKPHQLPFITALTETATSQLQKLLDNLEAPNNSSLSDTPPVLGTKRLKDAVENLVYVVQFSNCNGQSTILAKKLEIEKKKEIHGLEADIEQGIQDSILNGVHVLLRHLAEPSNSEQMFTQFCSLANVSFSSGELITHTHFQNAKDKLDLTVHKLGKKLAQNAIEEKVRLKRPEQVEKFAQKAFDAHKNDAISLITQLDLCSRNSREKIVMLQGGWSPDADILSDLEQIAQTLSPFSTKEQIISDLRALPQADQQAILRPLAPIYEKIDEITNKLLILQEQQILHRAHSQIATHLLEMKTLLESLNEKTIGSLENALDLIAKQLPVDALEVEEIRKKIAELKAAYEIVLTLEQKTKTLLFLKSQIEQKNAPLKTMLQTLENLPENDRQLLLPLIRYLGILSSQTSEYLSVLETLMTTIERIRAKYELDLNHSRAQLPSLTQLQNFIQHKTTGYQSLQQENLTQLILEQKEMQTRIEKLQEEILALQKEKQIQITPKHFGMLTGATLGALAYFIPKPMLGLFAVGAYVAKPYASVLFKENEAKLLSLATKVSLPLAMGAGAIPLVSQIPYVGIPLAVAGAANIGKSCVNQAVDGAISQGQDLVFQKITTFFASVYEFLLSGEISKPATKIIMNQVVTNFQ